MGSSREVGIVKSVTSKGFGFIRLKKDGSGNRRPDLFFHASECDNEFDNMGPGTHVTFCITADEQGREEAVDVCLEV